MSDNGSESRSGSRLIKNSVLTIFNTLFALANGWIISIWLARQIGPERYGVFTQVLWLIGTCGWIIGMGLILAVTKFIAEFRSRGEQDVVQSIVHSVLRLELLIAIIATVVLGLLRTRVASLFFRPEESLFFFIAILGIVPGIATAVFSATVEGIQKFEYFTYASLCITPLSFFSKVVMLWMGKGIEGILIVMLVFSFANMFFYAIVLKKEGIKFWRPGKKLSKDVRKRILKYNFSVLPIMLCDKIIWDKSEFFFLGLWCAAPQSAFYGLAYNTTQRFTSILPTTLWKVLFPAMSEYFGAGHRDKMVRVYFLATRYLAFVSFPVCAAGAILAYQLIHYLPGHPYIMAQRPLQILFLSAMITTLSNPGAAILYGYEKQSFILKLGAIMAVFNIVLDILLIREFGALGAAICFSATTVIGSVIGTIYTCKTMKLHFPIVSLSKIFFATIIMAIVMEIIVLRFPEVFGFVVSIVAGTIVYLVAALVLGTFEQEDYQLLESVKAVMPGQTKKWIDSILAIVAEFKTGDGSSDASPPRSDSAPRDENDF